MKNNLTLSGNNFKITLNEKNITLAGMGDEEAVLKKI
jgi:hypothetical protein